MSDEHEIELQNKITAKEQELERCYEEITYHRHVEQIHKDELDDKNQNIDNLEQVIKFQKEQIRRLKLSNLRNPAPRL